MTRQYPTNAITITTIHRPRPSIAAAFKWEIRKAGNLWYWLAIVLFNAIGIFNGWDQYQSYKPDFQAQGVTWAAVWGQAILLPSMVFMPVLVAAFADQADSRPEQCQWDPLPSPKEYRLGLASVRGHYAYGCPGPLPASPAPVGHPPDGQRPACPICRNLRLGMHLPDHSLDCQPLCLRCRSQEHGNFGIWAGQFGHARPAQHCILCQLAS